MRAVLTISVSKGASWAKVRDELRFRLEDVPLSFTNQAIQWLDDGLSVVVPMSHAERAADAIHNAGLPCVVEVRSILPQDDPAEDQLLKELYPAGDTSLRSEKPKDRYPPTRAAAERRTERARRRGLPQ